MIITKLQGGLGNQLFQWAFGRNLANLYNTPLYLETYFYKSDIPGVTKRDFSLNKFPYLNYNLTDNLENNGIQFLRFSEHPFFTNINYNSSYNYYLDGYFQSEKYFIESSDIIRNELSPTIDKLNKLRDKYPIDENNISIHIRRTDYVTSNGYHPVQSIEYYKQATEIIGDYDNIFVFSDDINWCKENLKFDNMIFVDGNDDVEDMWLMSLCNHNVIANSSFSWWGAWLNNNKNKKVIAPKNWFGQHVSVDTENIIPKNWIKI
jgi:hypothetical protein